MEKYEYFYMLKKYDNSNISENIEKFFPRLGYTMVLKIEISSLQRSL